MQILRLPPRHHPKATVTCPPLRWRAVRGVALKVVTAIAVGTAALAAVVSVTRPWGPVAAIAGAVVILAWFGACLAGLAHVVRRTREPVVFKVARGELTVTWPFLLARRTRVIRTSDVTGVVANITRAPLPGGGPTARLEIKRRHRRPLRVPGRRPVDEVNRAAAELRAVLHV